jgi:hypothetical protein
MPKLVTRKAAKRIWTTLSTYYGARYVSSKSLYGRFIKPFERMRLQRKGIDTAKELLDSRSFFVRAGDRILIVTKDVIGAKGTDPTEQVCLAGHEFEHYLQSEDVNGASHYYTEYWRRPGVRAMWEADGKLAEADVLHWLGYPLSDHGGAGIDVEWARVYCLGKAELKAAQDRYDRGVYKIHCGGCATKSGANTIAALRAIARKR